jgi:hypothetical protein
VAHPDDSLVLTPGKPVPPKKPKKMRQGIYFFFFVCAHLFLEDVVSPGVWEDEVDEVLTMEVSAEGQLVHHLRW